MTKSKSKSKSKSRIDYTTIAFYVCIIVCLLSIFIEYGIYKKQSLSTIFKNILDSVYASKYRIA